MCDGARIKIACLTCAVVGALLAYPCSVVEVGLGLRVGLQLLFLVAHVHPVVFHDLLEEYESTRHTGLCFDSRGAPTIAGHGCKKAKFIASEKNNAIE